MIYFFVGTIAELIKVFPVMKDLKARGHPFNIVSTGQNDLTQSELLTHLDHPVDVFLHRGPVRQSAVGVLRWFLATLSRSYLHLRRMIPRAQRSRSLVVVHGDTVSTLMGAILGRALGMRVGHVEAGLRSFKWLTPFPEEICRCLVSYLVSFHFSPNSWAVGNLARHKGRKICTHGNTLVDTLQFSRQVEKESALSAELRGQRYFVFVIHRQENIYDEALVRTLIRQIGQKTREGLTCVFILHEPARVAFEANGILQELHRFEGIRVVPRLRYVEFMAILAHAEFLVTDGGSNQEESYYLGKPCLLLRTATERTEGLDENVVLSRCDPEVIAEFLADPGRYRRDPLQARESPSAIISQALVEETAA
jgi:UDP-N-acetylglucosamine 2-epimerase (non-hydrolysing)